MSRPTFEPRDVVPVGRPRRRGWLTILAIAAVLVFGGGTAVSYYVEELWFQSLGFGDVFWKTVRLQGTIFVLSAACTFAVLYASFLALKPRRFDLFGAGGIVFVNGRPVQLPIAPLLRLLSFVVALVVALVSGVAMTDEWPTLAVWWHWSPDALPSAAAAARAVDPIFGRPLTFYLFTLPAWELIAGWLTTMAVIVCVAAVLSSIISSGIGLQAGWRSRMSPGGDRGLAISWAVVLLLMAVRTYLGRYERLLETHGVLSGVTYTDAHVTLRGALVISVALLAGSAIATAAAVSGRRARWLVVSVVPALFCYVGTAAIAWYVGNFVVRPNQLVRERPYITHNIEMTRQAYGLDRLVQREFPAEPGIAAVDQAHNEATLQNIRLWDWRALQATLQQIQAIRIYYDFSDIDIDRYRLGGTLRQVMLAARELNVNKLPAASRTWVNEKLIYTHGYGVTMNSVNGFTPEGLPDLILRNMPVESAVPDVKVTRPEIYFGELTTTDVYVNTGQKEFNYPQGQSNELTSYAGKGGIVLGGFFRRILIALDRGDLAKLPFSDDVGPESRLLMRRDIVKRVEALAPFLAFDPDPYIIIGDDGRLSWMLDGFTISNRYPYSRVVPFERRTINYIRNSVKAVVDAYDGTTTFYVFDTADPMLAAYRRVFPTLFRDRAAMPADIQSHVRYPELLLSVQADVYGLYHMTDPSVFYNREDLWTVANEIGLDQRQAQVAHAVEPNFVLMTLPGETGTEFVEILPFTPANRNNLIGWIAGRSDGSYYGDLVVYNFPKTRLVDGPLQIEARIDQDPQLSGQLTLWNQQGSRVRRGSLIVIAIGRGLLYAEPIYLQSDRSPMPELRLVVLALQDRLVYGPTFESALGKLFGERAPAPAVATPAAPGARPEAAAPAQAPDIDALIAQASRQMAEYQRLTAQGKLGDAGQMLEQLKQTLEELAKRRR